MIGLTRTDNPEIRERAARIVVDLSTELRITQFPDALRCICCLLDKKLHKVSVQTFEHRHHQEDGHLSVAIAEQANHKHLSSGELPKRKSRFQTIVIGIKKFHIPEWDRYFGDQYHYSYKSKGTGELISQGLVILERLTQDEDNCLEIIKHQRLPSKITLPLSHQEFSAGDTFKLEILNRSRTVVNMIISAGSGDDTARLRHDMLRNAVAIHNLVCILKVDSKDARKQHEQAIEILAVLAFDDSFRKLAFDESTSMKEMFAKTLRRIFLEDRNGNVIVAEEDTEEDTEKDKRVGRKAGEALARLLRIPSARENTDALTSATNVNDVDLLPNKNMVNLLTKVVDQILSSKAEKAADEATPAGPSNSCPAESQPPNGANTRQSSTQENEEQSVDSKLLAAMVSLTTAICNKNVISGDDFSRAVPDNAALVKKLKEMVEMKKNATTDGCRILKLVCQVVIAMVQLKATYIREFNEHNFKEALSKALKTMLDVDNCLIFAGDDREAPARSLASLVKEAQELLAQEQGDIISA